MALTIKPPDKVYNIEGMGGSTKDLRRYAEDDNELWSAMNPSLGYSEKDGYVCLFRSSNYFYTELGIIKVTTGSAIKNKVFVGQFNKNFELENIREVKFKGELSQTRGPEDPRIYSRNGEWCFTAIIQELEHTAEQRVATFKLDLEKAEATFIKKYESFDASLPEKNWLVPTKEDNNNFDFIYSATGIYKNDQIILSPNTDTELARLRGGSNLIALGDGTYLSISHRQYRKQLKNVYVEELSKTMDTFVRSYTHSFVRYDNYGKIIEISDEFVLDDFQLEFASGMVEHKDEFVISYGVNDSYCRLAFIAKETVFEMLHPLGDAEQWDE